MCSQMMNRLAISVFVCGSVLVSTPAFSAEKITPVLKQKLEGMENMEANIVLFEVEPGFATERHLHPGHVFVYVLEGVIEMDVEGSEPVRVSAGAAAYEIPNQPMVGRNASSTEGARFVVFQVGDAGKELMVAQPK